MRISRSALAWLVPLALAATTHAQSPNVCDQAGESPDVVVTGIPDTFSYGSEGGISAFAIGTTACNVGDCWLNWNSANADHPVIGQNLFRLKDGRFEQIGQSWVKHTFTASNQSCSGCVGGGDGNHLSVGCGDTYTAATNGVQFFLGPKWQVNPHSGAFPFPAGDPTGSGLTNARLQVHNADLDPALNPGAQYFAETQFVARDDAAGHNASWRQVSVSGAGASFTMAPTGPTHGGSPAVHAWKLVDPAVTLSDRRRAGRRQAPRGGQGDPDRPGDVALRVCDSERRFPPGCGLVSCARSTRGRRGQPPVPRRGLPQR